VSFTICRTSEGIFLVTLFDVQFTFIIFQVLCIMVVFKEEIN
jgi:hypothetical protein